MEDVLSKASLAKNAPAAVVGVDLAHSETPNGTSWNSSQLYWKL